MWIPVRMLGRSRHDQGRAGVQTGTVIASVRFREPSKIRFRSSINFLLLFFHKLSTLGAREPKTEKNVKTGKVQRHASPVHIAHISYFFPFSRPRGQNGQLLYRRSKGKMQPCKMWIPVHTLERSHHGQSQAGVQHGTVIASAGFREPSKIRFRSSINFLLLFFHKLSTLAAREPKAKKT